jgi:peptidoglycan/LPS O-acetylase OafA/YrhL
MQKQYFNNLNGIRFILATMVLIHHVAILLFVLHISNLYNKVGMLKAFGPVAVSLFFALSGFLITNILLTERQNTGTVSLKKFYLSRALRILPLYYFILIIHFYILPHTPLYALDKSIQVADIGNYLYSPIILPENLLRTLYFLLLPQIALALSVATAINLYQ